MMALVLPLIVPSVFNSRKHADKTVEENSPCDFCSPLFYRNLHGCLIYLRLFLYGCDTGGGKFVSNFSALSPGNFDGTLPWPF